jgi:hypothetical protein
MPLGDGSAWDETNPTNATYATQIDDYDKDLRVGTRSRMAIEHEWPASQSATNQAGQHKFVTLQNQSTHPTISGTQIAAIYSKTVVVGTTGGLQELFFVNEVGDEIQVSNRDGGAGTIVQVVNTQTGSVATCSTIIPYDDTIPQITEGDQVMSLAITPKSVSNKLKIDVVAHVSATPSTSMTVALFQDSTANALASGFTISYYNDEIVNIKFTYFMSAGTVSSTTFKVRAGTGTGTLTFNGYGGNRIHGGVLTSSITITEIQG